MSLISSNIVELCIFKFDQNRPWFLLLHRIPEETLYPNIWQMVTGSIENGEKAFEAAMREMAEETGLKPESVWVVPHISTFYDPKGDAVNFCPMFAAQVGAGNDPLLSAEHDEFGWYVFDDALKKLVWPGQREGLHVVNEYIVKSEKAAGLTKIM